MAEEEEKWTRDVQSKELNMSPSCSSFEVLEPHDPVISRLATNLFKKTNDYIQGELTAGQGHYDLLEEINRLAITKYTDLRHLAVNLSRTLSDYNDMYADQIKPLLQQIDAIDAQVAKFEENAYRLDAYSKQLRARFHELHQ
ncbi:biogenesis of lysosome-related organelles complex-1 subunit 2 domain-containing protein [Phthorimaea operculella]|nr:biogenesis of lysosome-related organelles complex-1 subunit 2 domain-containing protein [Phthorimaea operculella]